MSSGISKVCGFEIPNFKKWGFQIRDLWLPGFQIPKNQKFQFISWKYFFSLLFLFSSKIFCFKKWNMMRNNTAIGLALHRSMLSRWQIKIKTKIIVLCNIMPSSDLSKLFVYFVFIYFIYYVITVETVADRHFHCALTCLCGHGLFQKAKFSLPLVSP